jgi:hypothetical protein
LAGEGGSRGKWGEVSQSAWHGRIWLFVFLLTGVYFFYLIAGIWGFAYRDILEKENYQLTPEPGITV